MKFQPKRFVVEVKRGTSRASFASADASANRFGDAEAALFGPKGKVDAAFPAPRSAGSSGAEVPSGRILRSLVEPPPPAVEDLDPPVRRGRKPGSKNKPKPQAEAAPASDADRPRRGRKPGSKNRPKPQVPTAFPPASGLGRDDLAEAMRSYGFSDDGTAWAAPAASAASAAAPAAAAAFAGEAIPPGDAGPRPGSHIRLRDRSSILKRYVLDTEPRPGQPGALRARRAARTASRGAPRAI